jgi:probable rRNA maturation factor
MREIGAAEWDLSILLCDDARMRKLNGRYRGKDNTTDVLSFPREEHHRRSAASLEGSVVAGDIAISMDTLRRNAFALSVTEEEELKRLLIHGILHCAGMDHGTGKGKGMLALQERLLGELHQVRIIRK